MSDIVSKSQIGVCSKKQNILTMNLKGRLHSSEHDEKCCTKYFEDYSRFEQKKLLKNFKSEYSLILFDYFSEKNSINNKIDNFAIKAFDIDLPMSKVIEIHLDLINTLEKQLILDGLDAEYLSDFRLTLIDVMAHLGEIYRRNARSSKIVVF